VSSWSERAYADARAYLAHRARVVTELGPRLEAGDLLLDLACGDAAFADGGERVEDDVDDARCEPE